MSHLPRRLGKCTAKTQGKIIVKLEGKNIPKLGSPSYINVDGKFKSIGEVVEAIGSTQKPWLIISPDKGKTDVVEVDEILFIKENPEKRKIRREKKRRKLKKRRS
jgi:rRNA processing protein Gar1